MNTIEYFMSVFCQSVYVVIETRLFKKKHSCYFIFLNVLYTHIINKHLLHYLKSFKHEHIFCLCLSMSSDNTLNYFNF